MNLSKSAAYLENLIAEGYCDAYALSVCHRGACHRLFSRGVNADTLFDMASSGKVLVTSTLILHAVSAGIIALSDPLRRFFPNAPQDKAAVTVLQLLTHTSGILRYPLPRAVAVQGHDALAEFILRSPLAFAPGSQYTYSCNGFILLGFILEKVYGQPLASVFDAFLKKPLGMTRATFVLPEGEQNRVISHRRDTDGDFPADDENLYAIRECVGSGGQFYSVADAERLVNAIVGRNPLLYDRALFDLAERDHTPDYTVGRGLGYFYVDRRYSPDEPLLHDGSFGHWGSTGTCFFIDRSQDLSVIWFTNLRRGITRNYRLSYEAYEQKFSDFRRGLFATVADAL